MLTTEHLLSAKFALISPTSFGRSVGVVRSQTQAAGLLVFRIPDDGQIPEPRNSVRCVQSKFSHLLFIKIHFNIVQSENTLRCAVGFSIHTDANLKWDILINVSSLFIYSPISGFVFLFDGLFRPVSSHLHLV
jgi:hypothetical protein